MLGCTAFLVLALTLPVVARTGQTAEDPKQAAGSRVLGVVLYPGFELLDVFGPVEMWSYVPKLKVVLVAEKAGRVRSAQGPSVYADHGFEDCPALDILMVPGGLGTLKELQNEAFLAFLVNRHEQAEITTSVCSGSALLAKSGILDGHRATSNKMFFQLAVQQSAAVEWVRQARWVDDGPVITSSGVSAGMDMALYLVARLYGVEQAEQIARLTEYSWQRDSTNDPFAQPQR